MNPITLSTLACPNWWIKPIIAEAFELNYDERGATRQTKKINRPDQKKGG
jgi:hypothetical protein